jgi:Ca-activated chloride channel family protein
MDLSRPAAGVLLAVCLLATGASSAPASGAEPPAAAMPGVSLSGIGSGTLLMRMPSTREMLRAPALETEVSIRVTGLVARTHVVQRFANPTGDWVEGVYVFPLPERSAVDRLRLRIGERIVEGVLRERGEARRSYEAAKHAGRRASLVEQERANVFTTSVANIEPHGAITVEIEYQQQVHYESGAFSLRFPMVVGPRYIAGVPLDHSERALSHDIDGAQSHDDDGALPREVPGALPRDEHDVWRAAGSGWAAATDVVPGAPRITPPVLPPGSARRNPVTIRVDLDAGFALARLHSASHVLDTQASDDGRTTITLAAAPVPADRDFQLEWAPHVGQAPRAALFTERFEDASYALLMVMPPAPGDAHARLRREAIYVIDVSGSMGGASIRQAKAALDVALARLHDGDRFNVIAFASSTAMLYPGAREASAHTRREARAWARSLRAGGGTEMAPALRAALAGPAETGYLRQVVFLTDGAVGDEARLFAIIARRLGEARLFTVGIGSAPNAHFMREAASLGRGTFTFIGDLAQVEEVMGTLFAQLEQPLMRDLAVHWPASAGAVQMWPRRLPDLYAGQPLVVSAKLAAPGGELVIDGRRANEPWRTRLALDGGRGERGIHALWAREQIAALQARQAHGAPQDAIRRDVTEVALRHGLVTRWTSLVAVDSTPARPSGTDSATRAVPTQLPAGWEYEMVFGALPGTATAAPIHLLAGAALIAMALLAHRRRRRAV